MLNFQPRKVLSNVMPVNEWVDFGKEAYVGTNFRDEKNREIGYWIAVYPSKDWRNNGKPGFCMENHVTRDRVQFGGAYSSKVYATEELATRGAEQFALTVPKLAEKISRRRATIASYKAAAKTQGAAP